VLSSDLGDVLVERPDDLAAINTGANSDNATGDVVSLSISSSQSAYPRLGVVLMVIQDTEDYCIKI